MALRGGTNDFFNKLLNNNPKFNSSILTLFSFSTGSGEMEYNLCKYIKTANPNIKIVMVVFELEAVYKNNISNYKKMVDSQLISSFHFFKEFDDTLKSREPDNTHRSMLKVRVLALDKIINVPDKVVQKNKLLALVENMLNVYNLGDIIFTGRSIQFIKEINKKSENEYMPLLQLLDCFQKYSKNRFCFGFDQTTGSPESNKRITSLSTVSEFINYLEHI